MSTLNARILQAAFAAALGTAPLSFAAAPGEPVPVPREIIPGSELMATQERERYRYRLPLGGAGSFEERERLRAEHVKAMEERGRMRGLQVIDHSRAKKAAL